MNFPPASRIFPTLPLLSSFIAFSSPFQLQFGAYLTPQSKSNRPILRRKSQFRIHAPNTKRPNIPTQTRNDKSLSPRLREFTNPSKDGNETCCSDRGVILVC